MCLIAFAWNAHPRWRLVLAGNRDELHARPSAPLARWPGSPIMAGRDLLAGGTWLGVTTGGRCAVVTNVRDPHAAMDGHSRGLLVSEFLAGTDAADVHGDRLRARAAGYRPFNLLLFAGDQAACVGNHPVPYGRTLEPGMHALSNADLDTPWPKVLAIRQALQAWLAQADGDPQSLFTALADERLAPDAQLPDTGIGLPLERRLSAAFVRGGTYGTRASTLVAIAHDGSGFIVERSFGPGGAAGTETRLEFPSA
jgi:uncharacterized protein with NRDE domain